MIALTTAATAGACRPTGARSGCRSTRTMPAALLEALDVKHTTVVGYSMGGAIAQLLWRRHPNSSRPWSCGPPPPQLRGRSAVGPLLRLYTPMSHMARSLAGPTRCVVEWRINRRVAEGDRSEWARAELSQADPAALLSSMRSIGRFSSNTWVGDIDVPARGHRHHQGPHHPARSQRRLADGLPEGAARFEVEGPHDAIVSRSEDSVRCC